VPGVLSYEENGLCGVTGVLSFEIERRKEEKGLFFLNWGRPLRRPT